MNGSVCLYALSDVFMDLRQYLVAPLPQRAKAKSP